MMNIATRDDPPRISVLVTVYNRARFLAQCLDSILSSNWTNYEIVVVDDCSTDASVEIAETYARQHDAVRFVRNETNLGDYANRMKAASLASGTFLKYVDSDDLIYPHTLGVMVSAMEKYPDVALGIAHSKPEDEQPYPWRLTPEQSWIKEFLEDGCLGSGPTGAIMRKSSFEQVGGFRKWGVLSDTDLWYRMSAVAPIVLLPPGLVWWRRHDDQEYTRDSAADFYLDSGFRLALTALNSEECPLSTDERQRAINRVRHRHARRLLSTAIKGGKRRDSLRLMRNSGLSLRELVGGLRAYW
jgi:glycosyltransferase involved in cell wall biosynthesis